MVRSSYSHATASTLPLATSPSSSVTQLWKGASTQITGRIQLIMQQLVWETVPWETDLLDVIISLPAHLEIRPKPTSFGQFNSERGPGRKTTDFQGSYFSGSWSWTQRAQKTEEGRKRPPEKNNSTAQTRAILIHGFLCSKPPSLRYSAVQRDSRAPPSTECISNQVLINGKLSTLR